jgi:hypothetical protein
MNDANPWRLPSKKAGATMPSFNFRMDPLFKQALQELSDSESKTYGVKISQPTLIVNLSTRNGLYFKDRRSKLLQRYLQLKREKQDNERKRQREESGGKTF